MSSLCEPVSISLPSFKTLILSTPVIDESRWAEKINVLSDINSFSESI